MDIWVNILVKIIKIKLIAFIAFSILLKQNAYAQTPLIDSLRTELQKTTNIQDRLNLQIYLAHYFADIDFDSAKYYSNNTVQKSKEIGDSINLCHGYLKYALAYLCVYDTNYIDSCWSYVDSALNVAKKSKYDRGLTVCYQFESIVYTQIHEYEKAIENAILTYERCKEDKDSLNIAYCIYTICSFYNDSKDLEKALALFNENLYILDITQGLDIHSMLLNLLGRVYFNLHEFDQSIKYYKKAYDIYPKSNLKNTEVETKLLQQIAIAYFKNFERDSAERLFKKVINISKDSVNGEIINGNYYLLSSFLIDTEDFTNAEKYLLASLDYADKIQDKKMKLLSLELLVVLFKKTEDYNLAFKYIQKHTETKEFLKLEGLGNLVDKEIINAEFEKAKIELLRLKEAQEGMIKRNSISLILAIVSFALFIFLFFYQTRNLIKLNSSLKTQNTCNDFNKSTLDLVKLNKTTIVLISLLFALVNMLLYVLIYNNSVSIFKLMQWVIISIPISYGAFAIFGKLNYKTATKYFIQQLLIIILCNGLLVISYVLFNKNNTTPNNYLYISINLFTSFFIAFSVYSSFNYRKTITFLHNKIITDFNDKLKEKQIQHQQNDNTLPDNKHAITVDNMGKELEIDVNSIIYVTSDNVYQEFYRIINNKITKTLVRNTLNNIEQILSKHPQFLRCHRSFIVNTKKINSIEGNSRQYYFVLKHTEDKIPLSRKTSKEIVHDFSSLMA